MVSLFSFPTTPQFSQIESLAHFSYFARAFLENFGTLTYTARKTIPIASKAIMAIVLIRKKIVPLARAISDSNRNTESCVEIAGGLQACPRSLCCSMIPMHKPKPVEAAPKLVTLELACSIGRDFIGLPQYGQKFIMN